jgi:hypothetical protein
MVSSTKVPNSAWARLFKEIEDRRSYYVRLLIGTEPLVVDHGLHEEKIFVPARPRLHAEIGKRFLKWNELFHKCTPFRHDTTPPHTLAEIESVFLEPMRSVWCEFYLIWTEELTKDKWDRTRGREMRGKREREGERERGREKREDREKSEREGERQR